MPKDIRASIYDVMRALDELETANSPEIKSARKLIQHMLVREAKSRIEMETDIRGVLSAIDLLLKTAIDISRVRTMLDDILKALESGYYFGD